MPTTTDISVAFIKQYESDVHIAYQQMGSMLVNTVRNKKNVKGKSTIFQKIGKGVAAGKDRHGKVPVMNLEHDNVEVTLEDSYAGEWIDALDELKTNINERDAAIKAGAYALGRKTDAQIIAALGKSTNEIDASETGLTLAKALEAFAQFNELDVPDDGERYAVVTPKVWNQLLLIDQFAKSNFVDDKPFMKGKQCKNWLGIKWFVHTGLPIKNGVSKCFMYHSSAVGHASGADIKTDITWHGDYAAHFVNNMMSQGAGMIDNDGVIIMKCAEVAPEPEEDETPPQQGGN